MFQAFKNLKVKFVFEKESGLGFRNLLNWVPIL